MSNNLTKFSTSGSESRNKLRSTRWKFSKEEVDSGFDLLFEFFFTDSVSVLSCISLECFVDFFFNFFAVNIAINCFVLGALSSRSSVIVTSVVSFIFLFKLNFTSLESLISWDRWLSCNVRNWIWLVCELLS